MTSISRNTQTVFASSDAWGFAASSLILATFGMKRMAPLRVVAICSSLAVFTYGLLLHLTPICCCTRCYWRRAAEIDGALQQSRLRCVAPPSRLREVL